MTQQAAGTFEVSMKPLSSPADPPGAFPGRMSLDKQFAGDLIAVGQGLMLTAMTQTQGSAGYVAIERVTGTLDGRKGSFVLQHSGTMNRGAPQLSVMIVPDSGTDELVGISGQLTIRIADGKHFYELEYSFS
jgi:Protein of unknown function (DUF3224)